MKKLDKFILKIYIGPFLLTLAVVVFIFLTKFLMEQLDEIVGKDLSLIIYAKLFFYFALNAVPISLPLAILLSSLITFGNLGEHYELTAIKSAGISLIRILSPIFVFTLLVAFGSFWFNNNVVPWANLRAYSLLWDVRQKSPSLSLKEGTFYNGIPGYSIKVNKKHPNKESIEDIIIYDHSKGRGNKELILADSGRMYTAYDNRYLVLELYKGKNYHDESNTVTKVNNPKQEKFMRNSFDKSQIVFDLSFMDMDTTDMSAFGNHRIMKNTTKLDKDIDSLQVIQGKRLQETKRYFIINYQYHKTTLGFVDSNKIKNLEKEKLIKDKKTLDIKTKQLKDKSKQINNKEQIIQPKQKPNQLNNEQQLVKPKININATANLPSIKQAKDQLIFTPTNKASVLTKALSKVKGNKNLAESKVREIEGIKEERRKHIVEWHRKFALAFACLTMFLIGAPLGAIVKKGGLGMPILLSIIFFISFYVLSTTGEKWVKEGLIIPTLGMWFPNAILLGIGVFFLRQAKNDSRLLEGDWLFILQKKIAGIFKNKKRKANL